MEEAIEVKKTLNEENICYPQESTNFLETLSSSPYTKSMSRNTQTQEMEIVCYNRS